MDNKDNNNNNNNNNSIILVFNPGDLYRLEYKIIIIRMIAHIAEFDKFLLGAKVRGLGMEVPSGDQSKASVEGVGDQVPQKLKHFGAYKTLFCT